MQSNFSFLRGASKPEELVVTASLLGHAAMGLADRNTVAGVVRAWSQSKHIKLTKDAEPVTIPYHPGCRLVFGDGTPDILAYPQDRKGWGHLCRMLTQANLRPGDRAGKHCSWHEVLMLLERRGSRGSRLRFCRTCPPLTIDADAAARCSAHRFGKEIRLAVAPVSNSSRNDRF